MSLIYAIGDIHGCYGQLLAVIDQIAAHADGRRFNAIFLGDYVDRGADSRKVVQCIRSLTDGQGAGRSTWQALRGNHEEMMVRAVLERESIDMWEDNGGDATIRSYGGYASQMADDAKWFASLPTMIETENHVFVHAGCSPRYALADQPEEVRLWIRGWEREDHDFGKHVVYGHTPKRQPERRTFSTGLDTGACYGGPLTVGVFDAAVQSGPIGILAAE